jgi:hypothetical protein
VTINLNWTNLASKIVGVCIWVTQLSLFSISIINNLFQVPLSIFLHHQAFFFRLHHQNLSSSSGIIKIFLLQASSSKGLNNDQSLFFRLDHHQSFLSFFGIANDKGIRELTSKKRSLSCRCA